MALRFVCSIGTVRCMHPFVYILGGRAVGEEGAGFDNDFVVSPSSNESHLSSLEAW